MFTGIVQTKLPVYRLVRQKDFATFSFVFSDKFIEGLKIGASVAINGTCLTVRTIEKSTASKPNQNIVSFDAIAQTLKVTNLGALTEGSVANIERAARFGDEIGGHVLSGHIMRQVRVLDVLDTEYNRVIWLERPAELVPFILDKGFVALNGCSLTIAEVEPTRFSVHLIPETRDVTTFGEVQQGDQINLEVDSQTQAVVETVKQLLSDPQILAQIK